MLKQILPVIALTLLISSSGLAQNIPDTSKVTRIETRDGNFYNGSVVAEDSLVVILKTENLGEIRIPKNEIVSIKEFQHSVKVGSRLWLPNPQSSRYFWAPNGYGLKKGESYYQNIWVFYNQYSGGVSNNFSLGVGMLPLFLLGGTATPVWVIPKFSIPVVKDRFNIGTGALVGSIIGEGSSELFGLLFGTATFGSRDKNLSIGAAYGFTGNSFMKVPVINVSSLMRTGPRGYFVTENYIITVEGETAVVLSAGGRSIVRNIGIDYSLWIPIVRDMGTLIAIPVLGITIPIGKKK